MLRLGQLGRLGSAGRGSAWTPHGFLAGPDVLYDGTSFAYCFQDTASTTPVTAIGQSIARINDTASGPAGVGNYCVQATPTRRPIMGRQPVTGARNVLTWSEDLTNAAWSVFSIGISGTLLTATGSVYPSLYRSVPISFASATTVRASAGNQGLLSIELRGPSSGPNAVFDLSTGTVASGTGTIEPVSGYPGQYDCTIDLPAAVDPLLIIGMGASVEIGSTVNVHAVQIEKGSAFTTLQKVNEAWDVSESGVADSYSPWYDGIDDCLVSSSNADLSATDKATAWTGARKQDDSNVRSIVDFCANGSSTAGGFSFWANDPTDGSPGKWGASVQSGSGGGPDNAISAASYPAPDSAVLTAKISVTLTDAITLRRNGADIASLTALLPGTLGNGPVTIARGNANGFKGFIPVVCIKGSASTAAEIAAMEKWVSARTPGATL